MKTSSELRFRLSTIVALMALLVLAVATTSAKQDRGPKGFPDDWSHQHAVFSSPGTFDQLTSGAGASQESWSRYYGAQDDPRYLIQLKKREREQAALAESNGLSGSVAANWIAAQVTDARNYVQASGKAPESSKKAKKGPPPVQGEEIPRDWSNVMGGASGAGKVRTFPAKYNFGTTTQTCNDFVVYTTATAGATSTGTVNSRPGTFTGVPVAGETVTITNVPYTPDQVLTLTAHASDNIGTSFAVGANATEAATNLANAIVRNGGTVGGTATSSGAVVTLTSVTTAVTNANFTSSETLSNFTWGTQTAGTGTAGQPTIFALNQLYKDTVANGGCQTATQAVPATYWSYNTTGTIGAPTAATADLSPVLSFHDNGAQVAFVQRSGTTAYLVLLKWSSSSPGTLGAPTAPSDQTAADYRSCVAPCMTRFSLGANDTNSSPFVDYGGDIIYVGDNIGRLHKFTGVFQGTPAKTGSPWPANVSTVVVGTSGAVLSSPVYDPVSQKVYVGSNCDAGTANCNRLHHVDSGATVVNSGTIGSASDGAGAGDGNGVRDAPIVDSGLGKVYAFQGAFTTAGNDSLGAACGGTCNTVFQFATSFASGNSGSSVFVGLGGANGDLNRTMSAGAFDDAYYSSGGTGALYVCGSQPGAARRATLWKINLSSGSFNSKTQGPTLVDGDSNDGCAPTTVFKNGSEEYLFASVNNNASALGGGGCTQVTGCMYSYTLTNLSGAFNTTSTKSKIDSATTRYMSVSTSTALNTTEATVATTLTSAQAGTYLGMTITQGAASPAGTSFTYTLRKNATSQAITCQVGTGATTCSDSTNSATFVAGDTMDVMIVRTGAGTLDTTYGVLLLGSGAGFTWGTSTAATAAINSSGGTGGFVIDNALGGGGSQVYFTTRTSPGIAVQATQKLLK